MRSPIFYNRIMKTEKNLCWLLCHLIFRVGLVFFSVGLMRIILIIYIFGDPFPELSYCFLFYSEIIHSGIILYLKTWFPSLSFVFISNATFAKLKTLKLSLFVKKRIADFYFFRKNLNNVCEKHFACCKEVWFPLF